MFDAARRKGNWGLVVLATVLALGVFAQPASADSMLGFAYKINASTTIKKLNQTVNVPQGTFTGNIDIEKETISGSIKLPPATTTVMLAGIGVATATFKIVQAKPVTGHINLNNLKVTATSVFNLQVVSAYAPMVPVNLVGNKCTTATPITVTMSGIAHFTGTSTFSGTYTIPKFKTCGLATVALNQLIPGPGNTFTAKAHP